MSESSNHITDLTPLPQASVPPSNLPSIAEVRDTVLHHFPHLWPGVEAGLSTCATLLLADNANPTALIYMGAPSTGKTTIAKFFETAQVGNKPLCYRSDKFTPASFLSHSANVSKADLEQVHLLPKLRHRVLLTPELGPIFTGKTDDLKDRFATITRVLDGEGLSTDSGTHGQINLAGEYVFAWLGATTPFSKNVWQVMAQLGSRLFFLVMEGNTQPSKVELIQSLLEPDSYKERVGKSQVAVGNFLSHLFTYYGGPQGVAWNNTNAPQVVLELLVNCASLLAVMRTPYGLDPEQDANGPQNEGPTRAMSVLYNLARGHALIHGRTLLQSTDLPLIGAVMLSSMPKRRREVILGFVHQGGGTLTVHDLAGIAGVCPNTGQTIMQEMEWLKLVQFDKPGPGAASSIRLLPEWEWMATGPFRQLLLEAEAWQHNGV